jgi:hypothetical protein
MCEDIHQNFIWELKTIHMLIPKKHGLTHYRVTKRRSSRYWNDRVYLTEHLKIYDLFFRHIEKSHQIQSHANKKKILPPNLQKRNTYTHMERERERERCMCMDRWMDNYGVIIYISLGWDYGQRAHIFLPY